MCKEEKPLYEFNKNSSKTDGYQTFCRQCSNRQSKYYYEKNKTKHKEVVAKRRRQVITENHSKMLEFLATKACVDCGTRDTRVLEFDHIRDKKKNVSILLHTAYSWDTILEEIGKCEIVCANCHRIRTLERSKSYRMGS